MHDLKNLVFDARFPNAAKKHDVLNHAQSINDISKPNDLYLKNCLEVFDEFFQQIIIFRRSAER